MSWLGQVVEVEVEIPRGGRIKRHPDGRLDFISPFAAPFNYGSVPGVIGGDGDPLDVILLGPTVARGVRVSARVGGVVHFIDRGRTDDKLICVPPAASLSEADRRMIERFFRRYAPLRQVIDLLKGRGWTGLRTEGVEWA